MQTLLLRQLLDKDIALLERWLYMPHIAKWYHNPLSWIDEVQKRNDKYSFIHHFIVECGGKPIGFCQYYQYLYSREDWHGGTDIKGAYSIDYLIGDTEYLGKGFGKEIVGLLVDKIKQHNDAKRIIVQPEPENKASCNTLLSCGFSFDANKDIFIMEL